MKKLKLIKKLTLNKQTISNLNAEQTARIIGGGETWEYACTAGGSYNICTDLCTNGQLCEPMVTDTCETATCTPGETYTCTCSCTCPTNTCTVTCTCGCNTNGCATDACETEYNCESRPGYRVC